MKGLMSPLWSRFRRPEAVTRAARAVGFAADSAVRMSFESLEDRKLFVTYNIVDLGTLGGATAEAVGINASGQVAVNAALAPDSQSISTIRGSRYSGTSLTDVGTFVGPDSTAFGINAAGKVVGSAPDNIGGSDVGEQAFIWNGTSKTKLGSLGGSYSVASAVNDNDVVVGFAQDENDSGPEHAFIWQNGSMTDLGTLGSVSSDYSRASAINNAGQIAGESQVDTGETHAFLRTGSTMVDLGVMTGGDTSAAYGINEAGQVVGRGTRTGGGSALVTRAFYYAGSGGLQDLGVLTGDNYSAALDISNSGVIVGYSANNDNLDGQVATVFTAGVGVEDLNTLIPGGTGWTLLEARSVNDSGQIVGVGLLNGQRKAFRLTPTSGGGGDVTAPTASIVANAPVQGAATMTVTVTYTDETAVSVASIGANDISVTGSEGALTVTGVVTAPGTDAASIVATYTIAAPGGTWDSGDDGAYTVNLLASQVTDTSGNPALAGSVGFNVLFGTGATGPTAVIDAPSNVTTAGGTTGTFSVTYTDPDLVSFASLGIDDVTVASATSGPLPIISFAADQGADAATITVTYTFVPPGESWDATDSATYIVSVNTTLVTDALGNAANPASASFDVDIPVVLPTLDPGFNTGTPLNAGFVAEASVTDLFGRLYVAGHQGNLADGTSIAVLKRFNADGTPDTTFAGGQVATPAGQNDAYFNVALDPSGKFVVVSGTRSIDPAAGQDFLVARYNTKNGKLDGRYGTKGAATADLGGTAETAYGLATLADGSVYIGGGTSDGLVVQKLDKRGRLAETFGPGGTTRIPTGADSIVSSLVAQADGSVVIAGDLAGEVFVSRLTADGLIDPSFNGGVVRTISELGVRTDLGGPDRTIGLAVQLDGKILVANRTTSFDFGVVRLDAAGTNDATFGGGDGLTVINFGGVDDADSVLVQGTGQIVLSGTTDVGGTLQTAVVVLTSAGTPDATFDDDGQFTGDAAITDTATSAAAFTKGSLSPSGKLITLTGGTSATAGSGIRRFNIPGQGMLGTFGATGGKPTKLVFADADGTQATLSLKGGAATAFYDGQTVDVVLTGTSAASVLNIKTKGGDGRLALGNLRSDGAMNSIAGKTTDVDGTLFVNGELRKLNVGTVRGTVAATGNIGAATLNGDLAGALFLAGTSLGADAKIGGSDDVYAAALLTKLVVKNAVAASVVAVGLDPLDGDYFNGGVVTGGAGSVIRAVQVKRVTDGASRFFAGAFGKIRAPEKVDPAVDPRFEVA